MKGKTRFCNYENIKNYLNDHLPTIQSNNPSQMAAKLINLVQNAVCVNTSEFVEKRNRKYDLAPWINENLWALMELKKKLLRKRRKSRNKELVGL